MNDQNFRCDICLKNKEIKFIPELNDMYCLTNCFCTKDKIEKRNNLIESIKKNRINKKISEIKCVKCNQNFNNPSEVYINLSYKEFYCIKCKTGKVINLNLININCVIHNDMRNEYYCKTCRKEICNDCYINCNSKGHYIISFEKDYQNVKIEQYISDFEKQSSLLLQFNENLKNNFVKDYQNKIRNVMEYYEKNKKINDNIISMIKIMINNYRYSYKNNTLNYPVISNIINNCLYSNRPKLNITLKTDREILNYFNEYFIINKFNKEYMIKKFFEFKEATNFINITNNSYALCYNHKINIYNNEFKLIKELEHKYMEKIENPINIIRIGKTNQFISFSKSFFIIWDSISFEYCCINEEFEILFCNILSNKYILILNNGFIKVYEIENGKIKFYHKLNLSKGIYNKIEIINNNLLLLYSKYPYSQLNFKKISNDCKKIDLLPYQINKVIGFNKLKNNKIGIKQNDINYYQIYDCITFQYITFINMNLFNYSKLINHNNNLYLCKNQNGVYKLDINTYNIIDRLINYDFPYDYDYSPPSILYFNILNNGFLVVIYRKEIRIYSS